MSTAKTDLDIFTTPLPEPSDPAYDKWVERKIAHALKMSKKHPEKRIPQHVIMKKIWP